MWRASLVLRTQAQLQLSPPFLPPKYTNTAYTIQKHRRPRWRKVTFWYELNQVFVRLYNKINVEQAMHGIVKCNAALWWTHLYVQCSASWKPRINTYIVVRLKNKSLNWLNINLKHFSIQFTCKYNYNSYEMNNDKQGYKINIHKIFTKYPYNIIMTLLSSIMTI